MAQPGNFTPILLYSSSTSGNAPSAANLINSATGSEIAINIADKNLFFKDSGGTVNTVPIRQSSTSSNGWLSNTDWNTFNSKAPATSGTSLLYGNGSGGFSNVTIGSGISFAGGTLSATGSGGTVTSVSGTGTVNGLTLTGTVTTSGSLTLGGTLDLSSPPAIGGTTAAAITGTTITATTFSGSGASLTSIPNSALVNSTISGVALGGNLFSLTAGTGVSFSAGTTYNGSAAITINATGSGGTVTSVAALTLGTTGTDLSSTVANGTTTPVITLNVPTASATNRGALSAADWTTFNNKQPAGTYVTSVTGTAPVVSSGGTTPAISMAAATTSVNGYLTSTDWTTFNGKQTALVSGTNIKTVNGTTLLGSGDLGIISGTYGGTGVNNGASTITVGGNVNYSGAFTQTWTRTANTSLTLPISGTVISTVTNMAANPVTGTPSASNFLRGDGTWAVPTAGTGTVTSVSGTGTVNGITLTGTVTSSGSLTLGGTLDLSSPPAIGGTTPNTGAFNVLHGKSYAQTSQSSPYSIVDTSIYSNTATVGYGLGAIYDVYVGGDPYATGNTNYYSTVAGLIFISYGFNGSSGGNYISYTQIGINAVPVFPAQLVVTAVFWDGTTESTFTTSPTTNQIRIKVTYQDTGDIGYNQTVYLAKRL